MSENPSGQTADTPAEGAEPVQSLTPTAGVLILLLVLVVVGAFVTLALAGIDPSTFVLLVGAPVLTTVVGALLSRQVHAVERRAAVIQRQTNGALTSALADIRDQVAAEARSIRRMAVPASQDAPGSPLPAQRRGPEPTPTPRREQPTS